MTVCISCVTEEKILHQNAFAYDKWSVSHFMPVTSPNVYRFKNCFTAKLSNKSLVKWLLNNPPHLKHVATLPYDLSLITIHASDFHHFSDIDVSQGRAATRLRYGGIVNDILLHIYYSICQWKNLENNICRSYGQHYSGLLVFWLIVHMHCTKLVFSSSAIWYQRTSLAAACLLGHCYSFAFCH